MGPIFEKDIFLGPQTHHIEVEKSKKEYETQELVSTLFSYSINPKKQKAQSRRSKNSSLLATPLPSKYSKTDVYHQDPYY